MPCILTSLCFKISEIQCGEPEAIPHATFVARSYSYKKVLTYSCEKGYTLTGPRRRRCRKSGKWSRGPKCVGESFVGLSSEDFLSFFFL